jgi:hypothetical protein
MPVEGLITVVEKCKICSSALRSFLYSPATCSTAGATVLIRLCSYTAVVESDQAWHPSKTINKIMVFCVLILEFPNRIPRPNIAHQQMH